MNAEPLIMAYRLEADSLRQRRSAGSTSGLLRSENSASFGSRLTLSWRDKRGYRKKSVLPKYEVIISSVMVMPLDVSLQAAQSRSPSGCIWLKKEDHAF